MYSVVDEEAHKAAGGLPVVRVASTLIKAPIQDVALCWWQAGRRKVRLDSLHRRPALTGQKIGMILVMSVVFYWFGRLEGVRRRHYFLTCTGFVAGTVSVECIELRRVSFSGVGLRERAGFPAGAIVDTGFQAGVPSGKA